MLRIVIFVLLYCVWYTQAAFAASPDDIEVVWTGDNDFIESLLEGPDGRLYLASPFAKKFYVLDSEGDIETWETPSMPLNTAIIRGGFAATAINAPPDFSKAALPESWENLGSQVLIYSWDGELKGQYYGNNTWFYNGITPINRNTVLLSGQNKSSIFQFNTKDHSFSVWLNHELIGGPNNTTGINGIELSRPWIYYTNAARQGTFRVKIGRDGKPDGEPEKFFDVATDDFAVDDRSGGNVYLPAGDKIYLISPDGESEVFLDGVRTGTNALVSNDGQWLYWVASGRSPLAPPGMEEETQVLRIRLHD